MQKLWKSLVISLLLVVSSALVSSAHALTSNADLTVSSVVLTDKTGHAKTTFTPNEPIYVKFGLKNSGTETAYNQYTSSGFIWSQVYGNKATSVATNTGSDISVWTRNQNNIKPGQIITYDSTPTGINTTAFEGQNSWTKSTLGTYTARVFVNYDHLALENNYSNNQATVTYKIATTSQVTPTPTPKPTATPTPQVTAVPTPTKTPVPTATPMPPSDHIVATCSNGTVNLAFPALPAGSTSWAIRVDNTTLNGWGGNTPNAGDVVVNNYAGSTYSFKTNPGSDITWWVHSISSTGVYSDPTIGQLYCGLNTPTKLTFTHDGTSITLHWDTVAGATKYALRVDDTTNSFDPAAMQPGDHLKNSLTDNSYTFNVTPGHKIIWWVHGVDSKGRYSDAAIASFIRPINKPTGLTASYNEGKITLKWDAVIGAKNYAIRVDNTITPWDENNMQDGDHKVDTLTDTQFTFGAAKERKIVWWVHARDFEGNYTDPAIQEFYTPSY